VTDDEIVRQIFEENLNVDVGEICRITGMDALTVGRIKGQVSRWAKKPPKIEEGEEIPMEKEKAEWDGVPPLDKSGMSMREYVAFYGTVGLDRLKRDRLVEFLTVAPGIGKRSVAWIMKQYDMDPNVRRDLNSLMSLLTSAGVKQDVSYRICSAIAALEDEFSDLLAQPRPWVYPLRRPEDARYPPFPSGYPQAPSRFEPFARYPPPQPSQGPSYYDYGYGYPPYPSYTPRPEEIARRVAEELRKETQQQQAQAQTQAQQIVTITEPLRDAEGKLIYDKDGNPVYRKVVGPLGQAGMVSQEDPELRFMRKMKEWKDLTKPERAELSEDRIRNIIREETTKKEEPITKEDVMKASEQAAASVLASKEAEDKEEKRFERLEHAIRESGSAKTVEGYHEDAYRLLGQSLQTLATREPKTAKVVTEFMERILYGQVPPSKEVQPGARESIFEKLSEKYVTEE